MVVVGLLGNEKLLQPMTAPRRRPSYSLGWRLPRGHKTHSHWPVISSTTPRVTLYHHHRRPLDTRGLAFVDPSSAAPKTFIYTRVTKIGLIDLDDLTEEHASKHTWNVASIASISEEGIAGSRRLHRLQGLSDGTTKVE